jgi:hypothetical protein
MIRLVQPSRGHITQFFGARQVDGNPHAGQDYAYSNGVEIFPEVYAAADGVVLFAGDSRELSWPNIMYLNIDFDRSDAQDSSAGNYTIIAHYDAAGNRVALTGYGHQENVWVKAGDTVRAGQRIGTVGATGFSAGKHLHFDLVLAPFDVDDAPYYGRVDPNPYFTSGTTYNLNSSQLGSSTTEEGFLMALSDDEQRRILAAADMALDTPGRADGPRLMNSADGGYLVALLEGVSGQVGKTLNKEDGGYIVGLVGALQPGATDTGAIASAVVAAVGKDLAADVVAKISEKLGAA